jgi:hypothetical protein
MMAVLRCNRKHEMRSRDAHAIRRDKRIETTAE